MDWRERLTVDPAVCHGKVCVRGTRIMASVVLDNLAARRTEAQILADYPTLAADDIAAVLAYAADIVGERIVELPAMP